MPLPEKATADTLYLVDGAAVRQEDAIASGDLVCEWFALCANDAAVALPHPILGTVPTCNRCAAKYEAMS